MLGILSFQQPNYDALSLFHKKVKSVLYEKGGFRPAFMPGAPSENERNIIGIEGENGKVMVIQIAGILARRIICWVRKEDGVESGQRIGMIRFGSRTEVLFPKEAAEVCVRPGDRVKAGETIIGRWVR